MGVVDGVDMMDRVDGQDRVPYRLRSRPCRIAQCELRVGPGSPGGSRGPLGSLPIGPVLPGAGRLAILLGAPKDNENKYRSIIS